MRQLRIHKQITQRDENSVNLYFQEINRYPMISPEEEAELAARIRQGDDVALQKLVEANLRFVISVAKQYQNKGLSFPDLINEGNVGLVKAAQKFDETRGFKFISYAVWWIRQSIMQAISEQTRIVRLPLNRLADINKISKAIVHLEQIYQREPTNSELADFLDEKEELISDNYNIMRREVSLDKPLGTQENNDLTLYDLIETENMPAPDDKLMQESVNEDLLRVLSKLSERESLIITLSYGINNHKVHSLREIAGILGMTSERVRQIRSAGLLKMKNLMTGNYISNAIFNLNFISNG